MQPEPNPQASSSASVQLKRKDTYVEVVVVTGVVLQVDSLKTTIYGWMFPSVFPEGNVLYFKTVHSTDAIHTFFLNATTRDLKAMGG